MSQQSVRLKIDGSISLHVVVRLDESRKVTASLRKFPELPMAVYASGSINFQGEGACFFELLDENDAGNVLVLLDHLICQVSHLITTGEELPKRLAEHGVSKRWFNHIQASLNDAHHSVLSDGEEDLLRRHLVGFGDCTYFFLYKYRASLFIEIANFRSTPQMVVVRKVESSSFLDRCMKAKKELEEMITANR